MRVTGRVSLEELDAYAKSSGFDSWATYKLTLSDAEINLAFNTVYKAQKEPS